MNAVPVKTKDRILDVAERRFAENGFAATSLRDIIAEARVNLAAIHYHFKSKEALLDAVILRTLEPLNRDRLARLDECERAAGNDPVPLEQVIECFIAPMLRLTDELGRGATFPRLVGRILTEPGQHWARMVKQHMPETLRRFTHAIHRAVPEIPLQELYWRMFFCVGAAVHFLRGYKELQYITDGACGEPELQQTLSRLTAFAAAGFRAPVTESIYEHC
jgi:AcrR family transcriptional regulator